MLGRTDGQTNRRTNHTNGTDQTDQPDWIYMYLRTENKDRRTNWMDRQTDELDERTGRTDNLTNGLMIWKEGPCGRPNRLDERTEGQTNWRDRPNRPEGRIKRIGWTDRCTKVMD